MVAASLEAGGPDVRRAPGLHRNTAGRALSGAVGDERIRQLYSRQRGYLEEADTPRDALGSRVGGGRCLKNPERGWV